MLPASLAAWVPEFMARPTSACASAGASLVPSPIMATSLPSDCCRVMYASFDSGVASATKSSTPACCAMAAAVSGLSPVIMTVRRPIRRNRSKRWRMPGLRMSSRTTTPTMCRSFATTSGVAPRAATRVTVGIRSGGT